MRQFDRTASVPPATARSTLSGGAKAVSFEPDVRLRLGANPMTPLQGMLPLGWANVAGAGAPGRGRTTLGRAAKLADKITGEVAAHCTDVAPPKDHSAIIAGDRLTAILGAAIRHWRRGSEADLWNIVAREARARPQQVRVLALYLAVAPREPRARSPAIITETIGGKVETAERVLASLRGRVVLEAVHRLNQGGDANVK